MIDVDIGLTVGDATRRFTLDVRFAAPASVLALYGPSGAGKSLTLQAMAGLLRPASGHVRIAGTTLFDAARGINIAAPERGVGYLFQHYALFPHLSVRDNVAFGLRSWRRRRLDAHAARRVDALIESFGLQAMARSRPATLSGGQQQRVALARALACEPRMLLLDEPFAALNPILRRSLRDQLAMLRVRENVTLVVVTHDIDDIAALADQVVLIDEGRVQRQLALPPGQARADALQTLHEFGDAATART
jgi:molybdate transport system ATP-binding protein